jgi:hypothetical protein
MRHGIVLGIAAIAAALALSALFMNWEGGTGPTSASLPNTTLEEGRAATTDPVRKAPEHEFPNSLLD